MDKAEFDVFHSVELLLVPAGRLAKVLYSDRFFGVKWQGQSWDDFPDLIARGRRHTGCYPSFAP